MPSNLLVVRNIGATAQIGVLRGGLVLTDVKTVTGASVEAGTVSTSTRKRRGSSGLKLVSPTGTKLLVQLGSTIWESTDEGTTWAAATSFANAQSFQTTNFAYVIGSDGNPYVCIAGYGQGVEMRSLDVVSNTWRSDTQFDGITSLRAPYCPVLFPFQGKVHSSFVGRYLWFDPVSRTKFAQSHGLFDVDPDAQAFFTLQNRLFRTTREQSSPLRIYEFVLGSWVFVTTIDEIRFGSGGDPLGHLAAIKLADNSVLLFGRGSPSGSGGANVNDYGLEAIHLQISAGVLSKTRVTDPVVPSYLRWPASVPTPHFYEVFGYSDTLATPGTPEHYLFFSPNHDTPSPFSLFKVIDAATEMQLVETTQITNEWAPVEAYPGASGYMWSPGEVSVEIIGTTPTTTGLQISYRVHTAGGTPAADKTARFRFGANNTAAGSVCTLVAGSASPGTVSGNTVTGVTDNGSTHTVVWDFLADGVTDGSQTTNLIGEIVRP